MTLQATELMHNDWYSGLNVSNKRDRFQFDIYNLDFWGDCEPQPIPLTPEILKANGFCKYRDSDIYTISYQQNDICVDLKYNEIDVCVFSGRGTDYEECDRSCEIQFKNPIQLHQLQQNLRLLGLRDFADNFKIE